MTTGCSEAYRNAIGRMAAVAVTRRPHAPVGRETAHVDPAPEVPLGDITALTTSASRQADQRWITALPEALVTLDVRSSQAAG